MSIRQDLEGKLSDKVKAKKLIDEINEGIESKKGADLKNHIDKKLSDFGITDPTISEAIAQKVQPIK
jgi:hypothetical protein